MELVSGKESEEIDELFQSLVGFKINWNQGFINRNGGKLPFQSLVGFKINWNLEQIFICWFDVHGPFQSLVGFKINWNLRLKASTITLWFQSLVGFKINWNEIL